MNIDNDELIRDQYNGITRVNGCWHRFGKTGYAEYLPDYDHPDVWKVSGSVSNDRLSKIKAEAIENAGTSETAWNEITRVAKLRMEANEASKTIRVLLENHVSETPKHDPVAIQLLDRCKKLQQERGEQYDKAGSTERSFSNVAIAFNAITGKDITPAEVCLMQQILKDVRQWSNPHRLHKDSVEDGVSYASLKGEELYHQFGEKTL